MKVGYLMSFLADEHPFSEVKFFIDGQEIEIDGTWFAEEEDTVYLTDKSGADIIEELERH